MVRIWDFPVKKLCDKHLVAEHHELHVIWSVITNKKKGYSQHPETLRWKGKLKGLYKRHDEEVAEMLRRGFNHRTPLDKRQATGKSKQDTKVDTLKEQRRLIRMKKCKCRVNG